MEEALFIAPGKVPSFIGVERLYLGAEFCPWTLPGVAEIRHGMELARGASLPLTLVTPVFGEFFIEPLERILQEILPEFLPGDEVVISDWGAYALIKKIAPEQEVVLGRALSGQKRGPQILDFVLSPAQLAYFQESRFYSGEARQLLAELGITRIELDYPPQGLAVVPAPLHATLHTPFAMVTSSRNCPFRAGDGSRGCPVLCGEVFTLSSPQSRLPLLQGGNSQFVRMGAIPDNLAELGIDRVVTHTILPR